MGNAGSPIKNRWQNSLKGGGKRDYTPNYITYSR